MKHLVLNIVRLCGNKETRDILINTTAGNIVAQIFSKVIDTESVASSAPGSATGSKSLKMTEERESTSQKSRMKSTGSSGTGASTSNMKTQESKRSVSTSSSTNLPGGVSN